MVLPGHPTGLGLHRHCSGRQEPASPRTSTLIPAVPVLSKGRAAPQPCVPLGRAALIPWKVVPARRSCPDLLPQLMDTRASGLQTLLPTSLGAGQCAGWQQRLEGTCSPVVQEVRALLPGLVLLGPLSPSVLTLQPKASISSQALPQCSPSPAGAGSACTPQSAPAPAA